MNETQIDPNNVVQSPQDWRLPTRQQLLERIEQQQSTILILAVLYSTTTILALVELFYLVAK